MNRYYSFNDYMQKKYGEKVYKLALDAGLSCPNRDEDKAGGCIFCMNGGSGTFAKATIEEAKAFLRNQKEDEEPHAGELSNMQYYSDTRMGEPFEDAQSSAHGEGQHSFDVTYDNANDIADESRDDFADESHEFYEKPEQSSGLSDLDVTGSRTTPSFRSGIDESGSYGEGEEVTWQDPSLESGMPDNRSYGEGWERQTKNIGNKYVAYYQTYSNTYASAQRLKEIFEPALYDDEIVEIAIATRPDCIDDEIIDLLVDINSKKPVWIELGLQTMHDKTADYIRRGYHLEVFEEAYKKLREKGIDVVVHLIMGLPGEDFEDMLNTVRYVNSLDIQGVKVHMLTVVKGTELGDRYEAAAAKLPEGNGLMNLQTKITFEDGTDYMFIGLNKYADLICATLGLLRPEIVIHRLTGDADKNLLLSPMWTADKKRVLNTINRQLERRNITQGCLID